jgi:imidazolonepropionase-like amidohydrolase
MIVMTRALVIMVLLLPGSLEAAALACDPSPIVIRNVNVWTSRGRVGNRDVFVRDGRIAAIQPSGGALGIEARVLDGKGHTLLPGLVDAHLHFSVPGGLPKGTVPRSDTSAITARQLVMSGVTAGRLHLASLAEAIELKERSADPCAVIPRLQVGGPGISGSVERDSAAFQGARTVAEAIDKVAKFSAAGIDWIAIHDAHRFGPGVLPALADAARKAGIRLMAQGSTPAEALAALSIHPDTLDYIDRTSDAGYSRAVLDRIRSARDVVLVPTLGVPFRAVAYQRSPERLEDATNFRWFSAADAAFVLASARRDLHGKSSAAVAAWAPTLANKLTQLRSLGLPMAVGSDAGSPLHFQSNAIWWEMEAWRAAGVRHRDVLLAATETAARLLRLSDAGYLRPGARADFVLYRGNAEEGVFDAGRVIAVGKGGVIFR